MVWGTIKKKLSETNSYGSVNPRFSTVRYGNLKRPVAKERDDDLRNKYRNVKSQNVKRRLNKKRKSKAASFDPMWFAVTRLAPVTVGILMVTQTNLEKVPVEGLLERLNSLSNQTTIQIGSPVISSKPFTAVDQKEVAAQEKAPLFIRAAQKKVKGAELAQKRKYAGQLNEVEKKFKDAVGLGIIDDAVRAGTVLESQGIEVTAKDMLATQVYESSLGQNEGAKDNNYQAVNSTYLEYFVDHGKEYASLIRPVDPKQADDTLKLVSCIERIDISRTKSKFRINSRKYAAAFPHKKGNARSNIMAYKKQNFFMSGVIGIDRYHAKQNIIKSFEAKGDKDSVAFIKDYVAGSFNRLYHRLGAGDFKKMVKYRHSKASKAFPSASARNDLGVNGNKNAMTEISKIVEEYRAVEGKIDSLLSDHLKTSRGQKATRSMLKSIIANTSIAKVGPKL